MSIKTIVFQHLGFLMVQTVVIRYPLLLFGFKESQLNLFIPFISFFCHIGHLRVELGCFQTFDWNMSWHRSFFWTATLQQSLYASKLACPRHGVIFFSLFINQKQWGFNGTKHQCIPMWLICSCGVDVMHLLAASMM